MNEDIKQLRDVMRRIAVLGAKRLDENLGIAAMRMAYMRESLLAALRGDLTVLETAEHLLNDDGDSDEHT